MIVAVWGVLLKTLLFSFSFYPLLLNCAGSKKGEDPPLSKKSSNSSVDKKASKPDLKVAKKKSDEDVKFDIKVKKEEKKKDEFDDDEENPLAKIPTKARLPKPKGGATPTGTTPNATTPVADLNGECPLLATNEKAIGASVYAKPRGW